MSNKFYDVVFDNVEVPIWMKLVLPSNLKIYGKLIIKDNNDSSLSVYKVESSVDNTPLDLNPLEVRLTKTNNEYSGNIDTSLYSCNVNITENPSTKGLDLVKYIVSLKKFIPITLEFKGNGTLIGEQGDIPDTPSEPSEPEVPEETPSNEDAINIKSIEWLGKNYSNSSLESTPRILSASMDERNIKTKYTSYSWPIKSMGVECDAICCLFYERNGKIVGGKFDWWRKGGQGSKTLENVHNGYQGHSFPLKGSKVYTMIVSVDEKKRSNICRVEW